MGGLGGIYAFGDEALDPQALDALSAALAVIGPDGQELVEDGSVAMVHRPFHTHAGSRLDTQPSRHSRGRLVCWDGRLDNRLALAADLQLPETARESEVVAAAFDRWGLDALGRLLGDFALAHWDPCVLELTLATDAFGMRHLLYHHSSRGVVWASLARAVLAGAGLDEQVDDEFVAGFLIRHRDATRSAFRNVLHLPGGHALRVRQDRIALHRYYRPQPGSDIRYRTDGEYEEHLRQLLEDVVATNLRSDRPVFAELSGGLDSSTIVCLADQINKKAGKPKALHTVSYVYDQDFRSDERKYILQIEERSGRRGLHIRNEDHCIMRPPAHGPGFRPDEPNGQMVYLARHGHLAQCMAACDARVLLRGFGGDEVFWSTLDPGPLAIADLLSRARVGAALAVCRHWAVALGWPFLRTLWLGGLLPLLPRSYQARSGSFQSDGFYRQPAALLGESFRRRVDLEDRVLGPLPDTDLPLPSQRAQCASIMEMADFVVPNLMLEEGCVEIRYPFFDRRLVELMLALPLDQKLRPGETRSIQRRALRGILPEGVRTRRSKGGPGEAFHRTLLRQWSWTSALLQQPLVVEYGYIDPDALRLFLQRARHGMHTGPLLRIVALEFWLQSLDRHVGDRVSRSLPHLWQQNTTPIGGMHHGNLRSA